jgi:hypothetical protein
MNRRGKNTSKNPITAEISSEFPVSPRLEIAAMSALGADTRAGKGPDKRNETPSLPFNVEILEISGGNPQEPPC